MNVESSFYHLFRGKNYLFVLFSIHCCSCNIMCLELNIQVIDVDKNACWSFNTPSIMNLLNIPIWCHVFPLWPDKNVCTNVITPIRRVLLWTPYSTLIGKSIYYHLYVLNIKPSCSHICCSWKRSFTNSKLVKKTNIFHLWVVSMNVGWDSNWLHITMCRMNHNYLWPSLEEFRV